MRSDRVGLKFVGKNCAHASQPCGRASRSLFFLSIPVFPLHLWLIPGFSWVVIRNPATNARIENIQLGFVIGSEDFLVHLAQIGWWRCLRLEREVRPRFELIMLQFHFRDLFWLFERHYSQDEKSHESTFDLNETGYQFKNEIYFFAPPQCRRLGLARTKANEVGRPYSRGNRHLRKKRLFDSIWQIENILLWFKTQIIVARWC
jgi:hypothetical protein